MKKQVVKHRTNGSDGACAVADLARALRGLPKLPEGVRLRKTDLPYVKLVLDSRKHGDWNATDLFHVVNLARCFADIERMSNEVEREEDVMRSDSGMVRLNPKYDLIETLSRRAVQLTRLLQMDALSRFGDTHRKHVARRAQAAEAAAKAAANLAAEGTDDLLAMPDDAAREPKSTIQ